LKTAVFKMTGDALLEKMFQATKFPGQPGAPKVSPPSDTMSVSVLRGERDCQPLFPQKNAT
jgi:hypothetical protein